MKAHYKSPIVDSHADYLARWHTFTALLNGVAVESLTTVTSFDEPDAFHGFSGIVFNSIEVYVESDLTLIDNIQFRNVAKSVSDSGMTASLLGIAIGGLTWLRRRL